MKEVTYGWYPSAKDVYRNAARYHNNPYGKSPFPIKVRSAIRASNLYPGRMHPLCKRLFHTSANFYLMYLMYWAVASMVA